MGLIKSIIAATNSTLKDAYQDFFICDNMGDQVLVRKGKSRNNSYSSNKGQTNIITDGSVVIVGSGQCALIVEQGAVIEFVAEPGEYVWDTGKSPSVLTNGMAGLKGMVGQIADRFKAGGNTMIDQRVVYVNTKLIMENKFGTGSINFKDYEFGPDAGFTMSVKAHGTYGFQVVNPVLFYETLPGFSNQDYVVEEVSGELKGATIQALGSAFTAVSRAGISYDQIPANNKALTEAIREELREKWEDLIGVTTVFINVSIEVDEDSKKKMEEFQEARLLSNPMMAAGRLTSAQAQAMQTAAGNKSGAMMGFMGMGMAQAAGGIEGQALYQMNAQNGMNQGMMNQTQQTSAPVAPAAGAWDCACGNKPSGKFCPECGAKKPEPVQAEGWTCTCGVVNTGKFCMECGSQKPVEEAGWQCSCGTVNTGKFCMNCGSQKPAELDAKCETCGFEGSTPFKYCPQCGAENKE